MQTLAHKSIASLPSPRGLPLLGNSLQIDMPHLHLQLEQWARELGPLYTIRLLGKRIVIVGDTALMHEIMQARPDDFRRLSPMEAVFKELGAHGVFSAEGASWKVQRKLVVPAFSIRQQRDLYPSIAVYTERLRRHWLRAAARGEAVDVRRDLLRFTVDITCRVVFGRDLNTLENQDSQLQDHLSRIFNALYRRVTAPLAYWRWCRLPSDWAIDRSLREVGEFIRCMIDQARATLERNPACEQSPKTLLEAMLVAQRDTPTEERLSDDDISGNVLTLLLAGEETTSNTLAWMLHYTAHERAVQLQLQAEADAVFGLGERHAARYDDIAKLRFASAVTQEALRLRSAAPLSFLESNRALTIGGVEIPSGTAIFLLMRYAALSEENFENPHTFDPERWLGSPPATACPAHQPRAMLAFGGGPRSCPGRSLALFECAMVLSMVARNFMLHPVSGRNDVDEIFDFTMQPRGLLVRFAAR